MNYRELQKLTELLKRMKELKSVISVLKNLRQMRENPETREWFEKNHDFFQGLKPEDWAWLKEKSDYDEKAWAEIVKVFDAKEGGLP